MINRSMGARGGWRKTRTPDDWLQRAGGDAPAKAVKVGCVGGAAGWRRKERQAKRMMLLHSAGWIGIQDIWGIEGRFNHQTSPPLFFCAWSFASFPLHGIYLNFLKRVFSFQLFNVDIIEKGRKKNLADAVNLSTRMDRWGVSHLITRERPLIAITSTNLRNGKRSRTTRAKITSSKIKKRKKNCSSIRPETMTLKKKTIQNSQKKLAKHVESLNDVVSNRLPPRTTRVNPCHSVFIQVFQKN